jgi:YD repeat-containing protein
MRVNSILLIAASFLLHACIGQSKQKYSDEFLKNIRIVLNPKISTNSIDAQLYGGYTESISKIKKIEVTEIELGKEIANISEFNEKNKIVSYMRIRETGNLPVQYEYDKTGNLISQIDSPRVFSYKYNDLNQIIEYKLPGKYVIHYSYKKDTVIMESTDTFQIKNPLTNQDITVQKNTYISKYNEKGFLVYNKHFAFGEENKFDENFYTYDAENKIIRREEIDKKYSVNREFINFYNELGLLIKQEYYENQLLNYTHFIEYEFEKGDNENTGINIKEYNLEKGSDKKYPVGIKKYIFDKRGNWIYQRNSSGETKRKILYF